MRYRLFSLLVLACSAAVVFADSWSFPAKLTTQTYDFGGTKLVVEIDGTKSQAFPPHALSIYAGDQLLAKYRNVGFDKVYASKDNRFFLGASNSGIPGTAFVVFDAEGNLLREVKHFYLPEAMYTSRSVTLERIWFDEKEPDVQFKMREDMLAGVYIRGSNKQRYDLLEDDFGFRQTREGRPDR